MEELIKLLKPLYKNNTQKVVDSLREYISELPKIRPAYPNKYWYKFVDLYVTYPDGVIYNKTKTPLQNLLPHITHIKQLGCNALHILPFLESPMVDKGFDISNYYRIRSDLGTLEDLLEIKKTADSHQIRIFMDLVFNHVSDKHEWFQKALAGDSYYRDLFIWRQKKPTFIRRIEKNNAFWGEYLVGGKTKLVRIEFPHAAGPVPHWIQREDGNWYYHTYYPQQIDLDWFNPNVFIEISKVLLYWASLGFNFRLDATPFIAKTAYKAVDGGNEYTHIVLSGLKNLSEQINPEAAFLIESYESIDTVLSYFGNSNRVIANLGYNFHLCAFTWISLVKQNPFFIWDMINKLTFIPKHAEWINFLRNHDELSMGYGDLKIISDVKKDLLPHGKSFGLNVTGRTYSLLGKNKKRFLMAYFLLASMPGGILIPYGDEIGKENYPVNKLKKHEKTDMRNINRGTFNGRDFKSEKQEIISEMKKIIGKRHILREYLNVLPEELKLDIRIVSGVYRTGSSELIFFINLSKDSITFTFVSKGHKKIMSVNNTHVNSEKITLGPYACIWLQK